MKNEFEATDFQGTGHSISVEMLPDQCPLCHKGIEPKFRFAFFRDNDYPTVSNNEVQAIFQCPRIQCRALFIAYYFQYNEGPRHLRVPEYQLDGLSPYSHEEKIFPDSIKNLSPSFCTIFNQATEAQGRKMTEIAGPGYRKALEFLIKDFLISENPDETQEIKKQWLGDLIRDKIKDTNIKVCAERAAWLGNDETHYLRKWSDKDIGDLTKLITLSVNWIENVLLTKDYSKTMGPKGASNAKS